MTPRTPSRRRGARALLALGASGMVLGLAACSSAGDPTAAAVVDGRVVSESDVQTAVAELPTEITQGNTIDPVEIVSLLVAQDVVEDVAREYTTVATNDDAQELLASVDTEAGREPQQYSEATLRVIAINLMLGSIQQTEVAAPALAEGITALEQADVTLNPRYGTIGEQGQLQFGDFRHDWLVTPDPETQAMPEG